MIPTRLMPTGSVPSAEHYVQDGLIAMWDGIENAGWGVSDPDASVWRNLVTGSGVDIQKAYGGAFTDAGLVFPTSYGKALETGFTPPQGPLTIQFTGTVTSASTGGCLWGFQWLGPAGTMHECFVAVNARAQLLRYIVNSAGTSANNNAYDVGRTTPLGAWMVSVTAGDPTGTPYWSIYLDGTLVNNSRLPQGWMALRPFLIGNRAFVNSPFRGVVHCIRMYSRVLTADEIKHNGDLDRRRFKLP